MNIKDYQAGTYIGKHLMISPSTNFDICKVMAPDATNILPSPLYTVVTRMYCCQHSLARVIKYALGINDD